jgi:hypothetical protein
MGGRDAAMSWLNVETGCEGGRPVGSRHRG